MSLPLHARTARTANSLDHLKECILSIPETVAMLVLISEH